MKGVDLKTVQELMGHRSFAMTLRYMHLSSSHRQEAAENLGKKMQGIVTRGSVRIQQVFANEVLEIGHQVTKISICLKVN